jgi:hypothetical protein
LKTSNTGRVRKERFEVLQYWQSQEGKVLGLPILAASGRKGLKSSNTDRVRKERFEVLQYWQIQEGKVFKSSTTSRARW